MFAKPKSIIGKITSYVLIVESLFSFLYLMFHIKTVFYQLKYYISIYKYEAVFLFVLGIIIYKQVKKFIIKKKEKKQWIK